MYSIFYSRIFKCFYNDFTKKLKTRLVRKKVIFVQEQTLDWQTLDRQTLDIHDTNPRQVQTLEKIVRKS